LLNRVPTAGIFDERLSPADTCHVVGSWIVTKLNAKTTTFYKVESELGRMCKEGVVALALYLLVGNEESHAHCRRIAGLWTEIEKFELMAEMRHFRLPPRCR